MHSLYLRDTLANWPSCASVVALERRLWSTKRKLFSARSLCLAIVLVSSSAASQCVCSPIVTTEANFLCSASPQINNLLCAVGFGGEMPDGLYVLNSNSS